MSTIVKYDGSIILAINNTTKLLKTGGTWAEEDIEITDSSIPGCDAGNIHQDDNGYLVIDDDVSEELDIKGVKFETNGEYTAPNGVAYNSVTVDIPLQNNDWINGTIKKIHYSDLEGITTIGKYAFRYCQELNEVVIANSVTEIGVGAFEYCTLLDSIIIPSSVITIRSYAFSNSGLTNIVIPKTVVNMDQYIFNQCVSLKTVEMYGRKTWLSSSYGSRYLFNKCSALESVKIIHSNFAGNGGEFMDCISLTDVYCPKNHIAQPGVFQNCTALKRLALPNDDTCYTGAFKNAGLEAIDFGLRTQFFRENIFQNCASLNTIVLRGATLTSLTYINVFAGTPFSDGGAGGTIYIPKVLYDELGTGSSLDYKAATNWSTFDSYGTITWAQIEGSEYEHYYVDGRGVLQTVTKNLTNCSISNDIAHYHTEFETTIIPDDGYTLGTVTVMMGGVNITDSVYDNTTKTITIISPDGEIVITASAT